MVLYHLLTQPLDLLLPTLVTLALRSLDFHQECVRFLEHGLVQNHLAPVSVHIVYDGFVMCCNLKALGCVGVCMCVCVYVCTCLHTCVCVFLVFAQNLQDERLSKIWAEELYAVCTFKIKFS